MNRIELCGTAVAAVLFFWLLSAPLSIHEVDFLRAAPEDLKKEGCDPEQCLVWALGERWWVSFPDEELMSRGINIRQLDGKFKAVIIQAAYAGFRINNKWNVRHSDLFLLQDQSSYKESIKKIALACRARGTDE